jgi:hypothetical protein
MNAPRQEMDGLRLHLRHVRAVDPTAGPLCTPSIRAWCRQHGIDLRALCEDGIVIDDYPHLHDDPFVARAIAIVRAETTTESPPHPEHRDAS